MEQSDNFFFRSFTISLTEEEQCHCDISPIDKAVKQSWKSRTLTKKKCVKNYMMGQRQVVHEKRQIDYVLGVMCWWRCWSWVCTFWLVCWAMSRDVRRGGAGGGEGSRACGARFLSLSLSLSLSHADFRTRLGAVRKLAKVMLRESVARPQLCVRTPCHGMVELCTVVGRQNSIFGMRRML